MFMAKTTNLANLPEIHKNYTNYADFALKIKQLMTFVYVPVTHAIEKFDQL